MWYELICQFDQFKSSLTLLNLRENVEDHVNTTMKLVTATDIPILFSNGDMFKDDRNIRHLDNLSLKTKDENEMSAVQKNHYHFYKSFPE